jgi:hypothetical protein
MKQVEQKYQQLTSVMNSSRLNQTDIYNTLSHKVKSELASFHESLELTRMSLRTLITDSSDAAKIHVEEEIKPFKQKFEALQIHRDDMDRQFRELAVKVTAHVKRSDDKLRTEM